MQHTCINYFAYNLYLWTLEFARIAEDECTFYKYLQFMNLKKECFAIAIHFVNF